MDLNEMMNGGEAGKSPLFACKGTVASVIVNGEADITVSENGFALTSMLDATRVSWAEVVQIFCEDYVVQVKTKTSQYSLFKLGQNTEPLYAHLLSSYGAKVRKALFVSGSPTVVAKGNIGPLQGVPIEVYENCILSLPPDMSARRVPLCFVDGFQDEKFSFSISTMDGKEAEYSKLGYEHDPVVNAVQGAVKKLRAKTAEQIVELAPGTKEEQASQLAKHLPEGMAAPFGTIRGISPGFAEALEEKIAKSRAAETFRAFQAISGADNICVGFKKNDMGAFGAQTDEPGEISNETIEGAADADEMEKPEDPYMLWLIAPTPRRDACAVEFAGAADVSAATFVYRFSGDWDAFRIKLSMALEAISFKRDIIRLSDAELEKSENADYLMAIDRNEAVRFVRASFVGRAIHRSFDSWKSQLDDLLSD